MKKVAYISATILEILCLAGAWAVQFFTRTKMGMARYVVYKNRGWESRYPMELLAKGAALVMVLLTAMLLLCFLRRRRNLTKALWAVNAGMVLLTSGYAVFTWMNSADGFRAYYFISPILGDCVPDTVCQSMDWNVGVQEWMTGPGFGIKKRIKNRIKCRI